MSKFWESGPINLSQKVSKIISVRFMDSNVVKMSLMGSIWSKYVIFGENGQNWVILHNLGVKMPSYVKILESGPIILSLKVSKNYFRFMDINVVKNVINWVNLVKIGHIW